MIRNIRSIKMSIIQCTLKKWSYFINNSQLICYIFFLFLIFDTPNICLLPKIFKQNNVVNIILKVSNFIQTIQIIIGHVQSLLALKVYLYNYRNICVILFLSQSIFTSGYQEPVSTPPFSPSRRRVARSCACDPTVSIKLHASGTPLNWKSDRLM